MKLKIVTQTPIFTGDADGKMTTIRETAILGGMRWWYEAIARGVGKTVCDPTQEGRKCQNAPVCAACELFGSTQSARRFLLRTGELVNARQTDRIEVSIGRGRSWFLPPGKMGALWLTVKGLRRGGAKVEQQIATLLQFISQWGSIGAKGYIGYGVFKVEDTEGNPLQSGKASLSSLVPAEDAARRRRIPSEPTLSRMFFSRVTFSGIKNPLRLLGTEEEEVAVRNCFQCGFQPTSAHFRNQIRALFRDGPSLLPSLKNRKPHLQKLRHRTIGKVRDPSNEGAKIAASHLYRLDSSDDVAEALWQMRIWGYIPEDCLTNTAIERDAIISDLEEYFNDPGFWHGCFGDLPLQLHSVDFIADGRVFLNAD